MSETWWTRSGGAAAIAAARTEHLAALLKFVRAHSALYRDRWSDVPKDAPLEALPVVTKRELMDDFDRWVTEPSLTRAGVEAFLADRAHIGERHLGRYAVWKSSGTSGEPGIFVQDAAALSTYDAMIAVQLGAARLGGNTAQPAHPMLQAAGRSDACQQRRTGHAGRTRIGRPGAV